MKTYFSHIVEINEAERTLRIERLYPDGRRELFTEVVIPDVLSVEKRDVVSELALKLGENLLLDSPCARRLLNL